MEQLSNKIVEKKEYPIKLVQYGEGNFLRAFVDYMIDVSNKKGNTDIGIAIVKPIEFGDLERFNKQDNLYTVNLRGIQNGETVDQKHVVNSVQKSIAPFENLEEYEQLALLDSLEFVASNTTEAGIVFDEKDDINLPLPNTFPGKLTKFLYSRYNHFKGDPSKGLVIMPCELIERNGDKLNDCVLKYIDLWNLEDQFKNWIDNSNVFCNTLVDRIVTGYPHSEAQKIFEEMGYVDELLVTGEPFGFWVIESKKDISAKLPLDKAGLPVLFTDDQSPYRERKVRILNGAHTTTVLLAYLAGQNIVRECMQNSTIRAFLEEILRSEIIPTLTLPKQELEEFSKSVIERFENPFIDHKLLDISLNSISKWKARVLPTFQDSYKANKQIPNLIALSLAGLISFYNGDKLDDKVLVCNREQNDYNVIDNKEFLEFFAQNNKLETKDLVKNVMSNVDFWGEDLTSYPGFYDIVLDYVNQVKNDGVYKTIENALSKGGK